MHTTAGQVGSILIPTQASQLNHSSSCHWHLFKDSATKFDMLSGRRMPAGLAGEFRTLIEESQTLLDVCKLVLTFETKLLPAQAAG